LIKLLPSGIYVKTEELENMVQLVSTDPT